MSKNEVKNRIEKAILVSAEKQINSIDSTVENMVTRAIGSLLGISNSWGRAEIDHCNGRSSILTSIIEEKARRQVEKIVSTFKFDENDKEVLLAFQKEYKEQLKRRISWHAENEAKRIAEIIIKKFTDRELEKIGFEKDDTEKAKVSY